MRRALSTGLVVLVAMATGAEAYAAVPSALAPAAPAPPQLAPSPPAPPASAPPQGVVRAAWSTYLRAGPGQGFSALDEIEHDTPLRVLACDGGWCRVADGHAQGFVDRDALALPTIGRPSPPASTGCVKTALADDRNAMRTRFCAGG